MELENENNKKQVILSIIGIFILVMTIIGVSYAAFTFTKQGQEENVVRTGTVTMTYTEAENGISIENAIPMEEEKGKLLAGEGEIFDFTVSASITGRTTINYEIVAEKDESSTINDQYIRLYLEKSSVKDGTYSSVLEPKAFTPSESKSDLGAPEGVMQLDTGSFSTTDLEDISAKREFNQYYRLRMWVDSAFELSESVSTYKVTINVYGKGIE